MTSAPPPTNVWPAAPATATPVTSPAGVNVPPGVPALRPAASLTVANVHKEPVSVFRVRGGRLEFVAQVPPGEAVDIPVGSGAALAATFTQAPHCVNYAAKGLDGEVWLLRPAPAAPTCMAAPVTPAIVVAR